MNLLIVQGINILFYFLLVCGIILFSTAVLYWWVLRNMRLDLFVSHGFSSVTHKKGKCLSAHIHFLSLLIHLLFQKLSFLCTKFWRKKVPQLQFSFAELVQFPARLQIH